MKMFPLANNALLHKYVWGNGGTVLQIINLCTRRRRWVVSFTPRLHYPWRTTPDAHWEGDSVGPGAGLEAVDEKKNPFSTLPGIEHQLPRRNLVIIIADINILIISWRQHFKS